MENKIWDECYWCGSYNTEKKEGELICKNCGSSFERGVEDNGKM